MEYLHLIKHLTKDELKLDVANYKICNSWLARGDGIAVYENVDFASPQIGHRQFVSFGSQHAQLETEIPPQRLPDIGRSINWRYQLVGVYMGKPLVE